MASKYSGNTQAPTLNYSSEDMFNKEYIDNYGVGELSTDPDMETSGLYSTGERDDVSKNDKEVIDQVLKDRTEKLTEMLDDIEFYVDEPEFDDLMENKSFRLLSNDQLSKLASDLGDVSDDLLRSGETLTNDNTFFQKIERQRQDVLEEISIRNFYGVNR